MGVLRAALVAITVPVLTGCDIGLTDLGEGTLGLGGIPGPISFALEGEVFIGTHAVLEGEGLAHFYAPSDTVRPIITSPTRGGGYFVDGGGFGAEACTLLVRVELPDGRVSGARPVFSTPPDPCPPASRPFGARIDMAPYSPLPEARAVHGRVLVADEPPATGAYSVHLDFPRGGFDLEVEPDGSYRWETTDAALWLGACMGVLARAEQAGFHWDTRIAERPFETCGEDRAMADIRIGNIEAVVGTVLKSVGFDLLPVDAGTAVAALLNPADSSVVGDTMATLDDGTFRLWHPAGASSPGCEWLVRVTLASGPSITRPLLSDGQACRSSLVQEFVFGPAVVPELVLEVEDPLGDHTGRTDVRQMTMTIDPETGDYSIVLVADSAAPFVDSLRVNVNLFNPEASTFFFDTMNDLVIVDPVYEVVLEGTSSSLRAWRPGQEVFTNSLEGTPNPPGASLYRTSVTHFPIGFLTNEDVVAPGESGAPLVLRVR